MSKLIKNLVFKDSDVRFIFLLGLLLLLSYWKLLVNFGNQTFGHDLSMNWAYFEFMKKSVWQAGQYPLWLPNLFSGFPLDTSNLAAIFYPPHLINLLLPTTFSLNLLTIGHIYFIGIVSYFLARDGFGLSKWSAFFASLALMLSPKLMNHNYLGHLNLIESIPWLLLSFYFSMKSLKESKYYWAVISGLTLSMVMVVFSIFYIYALLLIGLYNFVSLFPLHITELKTNLLRFRFAAVSFLSSLFFGAIFLLPFLNFSTLSLRTKLTFWEGAFPALFWDNLAQHFYPLPHRFHDSETLIYVGLPTILLAIVAVVFKLRNRQTVFLFFLCLFAISVALGANAIFYKAYYQILPFFQFMRAPLRIWILFIIGCSLLAAIGLNVILNKYPKKAFQILVILMPTLVISLNLYNQDYFGLVNYDEHPSELAEAPKMDGRIYCLTNCWATPEGIGKDLHFASGGEVVLLKNYFDFMSVAGGYSFDGYTLSIPPYQVFSPDSIYFQKQEPNLKLLGLANIKYLVSPYPLENPNLTFIQKSESYHIYENNLALPRLFTVPNGLPLDKVDDLDHTDFKSTVRISDFPEKKQYEGSFKELSFQLDSPNKIKTNVSSTVGSFLVLSDTYFPGWRALIDGKEVPIYQANGAFRTIEVPPGDHEIVFTYAPIHLKIGAFITTISLLTLGFYTMKRRLLKRN